MRFRRSFRRTISLAVIYLGGSAWFVYMMGGTILHALVVCVLPFILPDVIKIVLALLLSSRLGRVKVQ